VRSLEAEKGCKLEVAMSSGKDVACNADSTVCGTSDVLSVMMSASQLQERGTRRAVARRCEIRIAQSALILIHRRLVPLHESILRPRHVTKMQKAGHSRDA